MGICECGKKVGDIHECELCGSFMCRDCIKLFNDCVGMDVVVKKPVCIQCFGIMEEEDEG
jgi:hypothetical protein